MKTKHGRCKLCKMKRLVLEIRSLWRSLPRGEYLCRESGGKHTSEMLGRYKKRLQLNFVLTELHEKLSSNKNVTYF